MSRWSHLLRPTVRHCGPCTGQIQEEGIAVFKTQLWLSEAAWKEFWQVRPGNKSGGLRNVSVECVCTIISPEVDGALPSGLRMEPSPWSQLPGGPCSKSMVFNSSWGWNGTVPSSLPLRHLEAEPWPCAPFSPAMKGRAVRHCRHPQVCSLHWWVAGSVSPQRTFLPARVWPLAPRPRSPRPAAGRAGFPTHPSCLLTTRQVLRLHSPMHLTQLLSRGSRLFAVCEKTATRQHLFFLKIKVCSLLS